MGCLEKAQDLYLKTESERERKREGKGIMFSPHPQILLTFKYFAFFSHLTPHSRLPICFLLIVFSKEAERTPGSCRGEPLGVWAWGREKGEWGQSPGSNVPGLWDGLQTAQWERMRSGFGLKLWVIWGSCEMHLNSFGHWLSAGQFYSRGDAWT